MIFDTPTAFHVFVKISLLQPQDVPPRCFIMLFVLSKDFFIAAVCLCHFMEQSKVTPNILGLSTFGTFLPSMITLRFLFESGANVENIVADDLDGDISRFLSINQSLRLVYLCLQMVILL